MCSKVCKNCQLSPVTCGQFNLTLLPSDVGSLIKEKISNNFDKWTIKTNGQYGGKLVTFDLQETQKKTVDRLKLFPSCQGY